MAISCNRFTGLALGALPRNGGDLALRITVWRGATPCVATGAVERLANAMATAR